MFGNNFVQGNDPPYMGFLRDYVNAYADLVQKLTKLYGDPYKSNGLDGFDDESWNSTFWHRKWPNALPIIVRGVLTTEESY